MNELNYRISQKALHDINEIWLYSKRNWSEQQADRYYQLLFEEINYLSKNVEAGKEIFHIRKGYRASKVKPHLIFYRVANDGWIEVIRVLHQSMDIPNRLKRQ